MSREVKGRGRAIVAIAAVLPLAVVMIAGCGIQAGVPEPPAVADDPVLDEVRPAEPTEEPVEVDDEPGILPNCNAILSSKDPAPGSELADCAAAAMTIEGSYSFTETTSLGGNERDVQLDPLAVDLRELGDDARVIAFDDVGWFYAPHLGWVQGDPCADEECQAAELSVLATRNASTPEFFRAFWSTSPEWIPLDPERSGAERLYRFAGTPDDGIGGVLEDFVLWVDGMFRPVRTETYDPIFGEPQVIEFSGWGEDFEIEAPTP